MNIGITVTTTIINTIEVLLFIRAVLSLIPFEEENAIEQFLISITEPFIMPFRVLFEKLNINPPIPIDLPYFTAVIVIAIIGVILESLI